MLGDVEASADADDNPQRLQTSEGTAMLRAYVSRMWKWAITPPTEDRMRPMTGAEFTEWTAAR